MQIFTNRMDVVSFLSFYMQILLLRSELVKVYLASTEDSLRGLGGRFMGGGEVYGGRFTAA